MKSRPDLRRRAPLIVAVALIALAVAIAVRSWDRYVADALDRWAVEELARRTDSTYRLVLGDLSFQPLAGALSFDSAAIVTDSARNRHRRAPLPALMARGEGCRVSGVDLTRLIFRKSFDARVLECRRMAVVLALPPRADSGRAPGLAGDPSRPLGLSAFRIKEIAIPALSLRLERLGRDRDGSILLEHARFEAADLALDLTADSAPGRGFSAGRANLAATGLALRTGPDIEITVERLEASLTDSTLTLAGARREPSMSEDQWVRRKKVRDDRVRFALDSLRARGVAYRAFITAGDIGVRALELEGARLDVLSDKRLPKGLPRRHRTPQQVAAGPGTAITLDTVLITRGTIVYREREPKRERPGVVSFDAVRATVLGLHLPPRKKPLRIAASARLMNAGPLTVEVTVPLDAPDFRYELSGTLGKMSAKAFNRFLVENEPFEVEEGSVEQVAFRQTVRAGRATTTVTPRYRDLGLDAIGGGGGVFGSVKRAVKDLVAGAFVVRSSNPDDDGENLRTATTLRRYDPTTTWLQFLWFSLRDGLMEAMKE